MLLVTAWMQNLLIPARNSLLLSAMVCLAFGSSAQELRQEFVFRQHTPMGGDALILMPAKKRIQLLATLDSKELEGVRQIRQGQDHFLRAPDGGPFRFYPEELKFRFSIGQNLISYEKSPSPIETTDSPDEFQSNLRFRLKLFRGLTPEVLEPTETKFIGVPKNIPYDQRIYMVRFKLPREVPAHERLKLEVLDRNGNQVAKFQVQLL
jgi:hypothetical protein